MRLRFRVIKRLVKVLTSESGFKFITATHTFCVFFITPPGHRRKSFLIYLNCWLKFLCWCFLNERLSRIPHAPPLPPLLLPWLAISTTPLTAGGGLVRRTILTTSNVWVFLLERKSLCDKKEVLGKIESNLGLNHCWLCEPGRISKWINMCLP